MKSGRYDGSILHVLKCSKAVQFFDANIKIKKPPRLSAKKVIKIFATEDGGDFDVSLQTNHRFHHIFSQIDWEMDLWDTYLSLPIPSDPI